MLVGPFSWVLGRAVPKMIPDWLDPYLLYASIGAGLVVAGFLIADLTNPGTGLSQWLAQKRRIFDPQFVPAATATETSDQNTPYFTLKFIKPASGISVELVVYDHIQFTINKLPTLISKTDAKDYSEGENAVVRAATINRKGGTGRDYWGDGSAELYPIRGTGNLLEIRAIKKQKVVQRYAVFVSYGEMDGPTANRYFYLQEDRHVFAR